jgi:hypothetical protein
LVDGLLDGATLAAAGAVAVAAAGAVAGIVVAPGTATGPFEPGTASTSLNMISDAVSG